MALALLPPTGITNLSRETPVAFARSSVRGVETAITFARAGRASDETAIAFAGEKKLFFVHFSVAVVSAVSCWPASVAAEVLLVSKLARGRVLCAKKFALLGPVRTRARKSSPCTRKMAQNRRFVARWASFFAITPLEGSRRAKFFAGLHKRPRAGRIKLCHRGSWHALRLSVSPARRADHSQAEADRA